jgi:hypothetical protein
MAMMRAVLRSVVAGAGFVLNALTMLAKKLSAPGAGPKVVTG